ncbi:MAG: Nif3-like dinuclear metal center hexameric protein [Clostridia bacterium]|nr:Nif3-like dinuclear metal center hexameric protein [Clostridia bacterium]
MKASEIKTLIEEAFPSSCAEGWDNVGFLVGRGSKEVKKLLLTLDVTPFVVSEAIDARVDMIVSHHPMMFSGISRITDDTVEGKMLLDLIENDIAVFAAHTNLDCAKGGLNDYLARLFELKNTEIVLKSNTEGAGLGRIGDLPSEMTAAEFAAIVKEKLNTPVRASGNLDKKVKRVAVGSGASDDIAATAVSMGADLIVTGDLKYHRTQDIVALGAVMIDAGHYPTEIMSIDIFEKVLKDTDVEIVKSKNKDIFKFV